VTDTESRRWLPTSWRLWAQRPALIAAVLAVDAVAFVAAAVIVSRSGPPEGIDWSRFSLLVAFAAIHVYSTREQDVQRRDPEPVVYVDLTAMWTFGAVLAVPLPLALAAIALVRVMRWPVRRRPLYRAVSATAATMLGAMLASAFVQVMGVRLGADVTWTGAIGQLAVLLAAGAIYQLGQGVLIGMFIVFARRRVSGALGTREDLRLEAAAATLGVVTGLVLTYNPFAAGIMVLVSVVGGQIARVQQLESDARTDPKTGLLNMRGWREAAERELDRARRTGGTLGLLMVDLDHFKQVNDTWGHPAGDDVLVGLAGTLRTHSRRGDVLGRFGGEEFLVLLPGVHDAEAVAAAHRIRGEVTRLAVPSTDKRGTPVVIQGRTTSVGVAMYPSDAGDVDELVQAADAAVYTAKELGRDQVWAGLPSGTSQAPDADR
jgi:diguanylate cyclase (GGDEF)-like protein